MSTCTPATIADNAICPKCFARDRIPAKNKTKIILTNSDG